MNAYEFCLDAIQKLNESPNFVNTFVDLHKQFYWQYHKGIVFSTRFGLDFFQEVAHAIRQNSPILPTNGEKIGEYDKNFNNWLTWQNIN